MELVESIWLKTDSLGLNQEVSMKHQTLTLRGDSIGLSELGFDLLLLEDPARISRWVGVRVTAVRPSEVAVCEASPVRCRRLGSALGGSALGVDAG